MRIPMGNWSFPLVLFIQNYGELFFPHSFEKFPVILWKLFCASFHLPIRNVIEARTKRKDGKNSQFVTRGKPLVTYGEFYFSPLVASPLMRKNPIPSSYPSFNSSFLHPKVDYFTIIIKWIYSQIIWYIISGANLGSEVINVIAKDSDDGSNGQVIFKILENNAKNTAAFSIDETTGKIVLQSQLDRETVDEYEIVIEAQDLGNPALTSTCLVHVKVQDENDNAPEFPVEKIKLQLSEDTNIGDSAYEFKAMDQDLGGNGKINYFLVGNNLNGFSIDSDSGVMTIASQVRKIICFDVLKDTWMLERIISMIIF